LIEEKPISFSVIGRVLRNDGKKIYRWYKAVLSGFTKPEEQLILHENDIVQGKVDPKTGEVPTLPVPICKSENFGDHMTIDDKNIGGEGYTIIANKNTGKIAVLAQTTKADVLADILQKIPVSIRYAVKIVSKDLAEGYDWIARSMFLKAIRVDDKFHVLKLGFEALQNVRVRYRQIVLTEERQKREEKKVLERELKVECKKFGKIWRKPKETTIKPKTYVNGDTKKELLARSRYLLFSFKEKWTSTQQERAKILFKEFPEIEKAYDLMIRFRGFYQTRVGDTASAKKRLKEWYKKVSTSNIDEMETFASTVQSHEGEILAYFATGQTNAYAESINAKIQRFVQSNQGTNDRNFFHFRLKRYFS
jgi:transposase